MGPAPPNLGMIQYIPHAYDPDVDTTEINSVRQSFFPFQCYGPDAPNICLFMKQWEGYSLTAELNLQKSLWLTGRGVSIT